MLRPMEKLTSKRRQRILNKFPTPYTLSRQRERNESNEEVKNSFKQQTSNDETGFLWKPSFRNTKPKSGAGRNVTVNSLPYSSKNNIRKKTPKPASDDFMSFIERRVLEPVTEDEFFEICDYLPKNYAVQFSALLLRNNNFFESSLQKSRSVLSEEDANLEAELPNLVTSSLKNTSPTLISDIAELILSDISTNPMIEKIVHAVGMLINAQQINCFILKGDEKSLKCLASTSELMRGEYFNTEGILSYVMRTNRTVNVDDLGNDWRGDPKYDRRNDIEYVRSALLTPVRDGSGKTIGVLECVNKLATENTIESFSSDHEKLLQSVASLASVVIMKHSLRKELKSYKKRVEALIQISDLSSAEYGKKRAVQKILRATETVVESELTVLYLIEENESLLTLWSNDERIGYKNMSTSLSNGFVGEAASKSRIINIENTDNSDWRYETDPIDKLLEFKTNNILAIPITDYLGKAVAVLELRNKSFQKGNEEDSGFTNEDIELLDTLAKTAASVLRQGMLYERESQTQRKLKALIQISDLMSADIGTDNLVNRIIQASYMLVDAERITFFLVEEFLSDSESMFSSSNATSVSIPEIENGKRRRARMSINNSFSLNSLNEIEGSLVMNVNEFKNNGNAVNEKVRMTNSEHRKLVCYVSKDPEFVGAMIPWGEGIAGHVAMTAKLLNIPNAQEDSRFNRNADEKTGFVTRSILTVPVMNEKGTVIAVIQTINKMNNQIFDEDDEQNMLSLANSAGIILQKSKLYISALSAAKRSRALLQLLKVSSNPNTTLEMVIEGIVDVAYQVLDADRVSVFFVDKDEIFSVVSKDVKGWSCKIGTGIAGTCAKTGEFVNIADAYKHSNFDRTFDLKSGYRTKSVLCGPVKDDDGKTLAVIQILNKKPPGSPPGPITEAEFKKYAELFIPFSRDDLEVLAAFCRQIKTTFRRLFAEARLERLPADVREEMGVSSLLELYSNKTKHNERFIANKEFIWPSSDISHSKLTEIETFTFNIWKYSSEDLLNLTYLIFQELGLLKKFKIPQEILQNFIANVSKGKTNVTEFLSDSDVFALVVASLTHDIDHPGNTNAFEVNSESRLALLHNDNTVLENHHSYKAFQVLRDPKCNIFVNMNREDRLALRTSIIECILATDMTTHWDAMKRLRSHEGDLKTLFKNDNTSKERQNLANTIIHTADLSGQVFPVPIAKGWEERISREYMNQADNEQKLGLPVQNFMQGLNDPLRRASLQVNFIDFVLDPWWEQIVRFFPGLKVCYDQLKINREEFRKLSVKSGPKLSEKKGKDDAKEDNFDEIDIASDVSD